MNYPGPIPYPPTLEGFTAWVYTVMGVPEEFLPPDAPASQTALSWAFEVSSLLVSCDWAGLLPPIYTLMVYNLGGHNLVCWAPDVSTNPPTYYRTEEKNGVEVGVGYFQFLRQDMDLNGFVPGVISASYDQGTGESLAVPDSLKNLTVADLQTLKTPWGRNYIGFAQQFGSAWGFTP